MAHPMGWINHLPSSGAAAVLLRLGHGGDIKCTLPARLPAVSPGETETG